MRYLSVCSGIEAATVAWHSLGWSPVAFSEIEPFPSAVLAHHYPNVPNVGDMTKYKEWNIGAIDLLVGGTPCQSFSVAGLRKGLEDPRGNLALVYCGILDRFKPKWFIWENVPGVLSSSGGRDFGSFLGAVAELGYGFAYRVLDAQYFGVAQRRRRVFVVGCLGNWRSAAEVLFEPESLRGDPAPSREARQITPTLTKECTGVSRTGHNEDGWYIPTIAKCLTRGAMQRLDSETETMIPIALAENTIGRQPQNGGNGDGFTVGGPMYTLNATGVHGVAAPIAFSSKDYGADATSDLSPTLRAMPHHESHANGGGQMAVALPIAYGVGESPETAHCLRSVASKADKHESTTYVAQPMVAPTLTAFNDPNRSPQSMEVTNQIATVHAASMAVRRLTPVECERLQGFPDGYTDIPKKVVSDFGNGPCAKQIVKATVVATNGAHFVATNHCDTPQSICARSGMPTGQGYELCASVCNQRAHAEVNAIKLAGKYTNGARLYIEGHTYACQHCLDAANDAGIEQVVIGKPPGTSPDGPRYKALGNSMAVPVMKWIAQRIEQISIKGNKYVSTR